LKLRSIANTDVTACLKPLTEMLFINRTSICVYHPTPYVRSYEAYMYCLENLLDEATWYWLRREEAIARTAGIRWTDPSWDADTSDAIERHIDESAATAGYVIALMHGLSQDRGLREHNGHRSAYNQGRLLAFVITVRIRLRTRQRFPPYPATTQTRTPPSPGNSRHGSDTGPTRVRRDSRVRHGSDTGSTRANDAGAGQSKDGEEKQETQEQGGKENESSVVGQVSCFYKK
jgi:hypothetical protein